MDANFSVPFYLTSDIPNKVWCRSVLIASHTPHQRISNLRAISVAILGLLPHPGCPRRVSIPTQPSAYCSDTRYLGSLAIKVYFNVLKDDDMSLANLHPVPICFVRTFPSRIQAFREQLNIPTFCTPQPILVLCVLTPSIDAATQVLPVKHPFVCYSNCAIGAALLLLNFGQGAPIMPKKTNGTYLRGNQLGLPSCACGLSSEKLTVERPPALFSFLMSWHFSLLCITRSHSREPVQLVLEKPGVVTGCSFRNAKFQ
jgi:hypothetical protein